MPRKQDMTLVVNVAVQGQVDANGNASVGAVYYQGPTMPNSNGVVMNDGHVDLRNMAFDPNQFDVDTDITFNLAGSIVDAHGNPLAFSFPDNPSEAVTITRKDGGPNNQLRAVAGNNPWQVIIDDDDNDSLTYDYCLNIKVATQAPGGVIVKLDPSIVNR